MNVLRVRILRCRHVLHVVGLCVRVLRGHGGTRTLLVRVVPRRRVIVCPCTALIALELLRATSIALISSGGTLLVALLLLRTSGVALILGGGALLVALLTALVAHGRPHPRAQRRQPAE